MVTRRDIEGTAEPRRSEASRLVRNAYPLSMDPAAAASAASLEPSERLRVDDVARLIQKSTSGVYLLRKNDPAFDRLFVRLSPRHTYIERQALERYLADLAAKGARSGDAAQQERSASSPSGSGQRFEDDLSRLHMIVSGVTALPLFPGGSR